MALPTAAWRSACTQLLRSIPPWPAPTRRVLSPIGFFGFTAALTQPGPAPRHKGEDSLSQGFSKRADREARGLAEPDHHGPPGPAVRVEENGAGSDPDRIQAELTPLREPRTERPV